MIEVTGGGTLHKDDPYVYAITIFEVPEILDGRGNIYTIDNNKKYYYWATIQNAIKININVVPKNFMFSFYHGMCI